MKKIKIIIFAVLILVSSNISCASEQKIKVVASIAPLADFARQVGGDKVDVILLLPPGASPHTYEPTPKIAQEISKAKIFIKIGAGLEFWADKLISAANRDIMIVTCSDGIELLKGNGHTHDHADNHKHSDIHNVDPHIWLDPVICMTIVKRIEDAFSKTDPVNSSYYKKKAAAYTASLSALDREISERVKTFRTKEYVTFHSAWNYFSRKYGLKVVGVIEESPGKEPGPKHIGKILREVKRMKTRVIFAEPQFSPKIAEAIAKEARGKVLILDPEGGQKGNETYIDLMRHNLSAMERAMK